MSKKSPVTEKEMIATTQDKGSDKSSDRLNLLKSRLSVAKTFCKKPHAAWKAWMNEYNIEDFGDTEEVRDKVRIGYVFRKAESDMPSIFDDKPDIFITGRRADAKPIIPIILGLNDYLWDVQHLEDKIDDAGLFFIVLGMAFLTSPWVTKTKKVSQTDPQTNETKEYDVPVVDNPLADCEDPFKIFFSPETKFNLVMDAEHCPYYFKEKTLSPEEVEYRWKKKVEATETLLMEADDKSPNINLDLAADKTIQKEDLKRVKVFEYWGVLPEDMAPTGKDKNGVEFGSWQYDKEYHIEMTNKEELFIEACPYDSKPLFTLGNYGFANKFWKFGDTKHLMPLIQEFQQYRSHLLEYTRKMSNPKPIVPEEAGIDEDAFFDTKIGRLVKFSNGVPPTYLSPSPMGREVLDGIQNVRMDLEKTAGSFDLTSGAADSTVKTPRGISVYAEAADRNISRKRKKIAKLIRELIIFQFKQVAQMWSPQDNKTLAVVNQTVPQALSVNQDVLSVIGGINQMYTLDIEVETLSINRVQLKRDSLDLWDLAQAHPEIFKLPEMAKDLLQNGYGKRDGDRYLVSEADRQQIMANKQIPPKVAVQIKADASTPVGDTLLQNEGLISPAQNVPISPAPGQPGLPTNTPPVAPVAPQNNFASAAQLPNMPAMPPTPGV